MGLDSEQCYRALRSHDPRFDGRFFVGVVTTGIYCRPVCTARTPLARHCSFFPSAAAAESRGFRPCLRCRPELAPGFASVDAARRLAQSAASLIEDGRLGDARLPALARALGVTDRHLRRVFRQEFGVAPVEFAQTQRLLLAKRLLTDTQMPVIDVAMASGFASLRRFNHLFRSRYRLTPAELRRTAPVRADSDALVFDLAFRPPYDWEAMLAFLARRAIPGVEAVCATAYERTLRIELRDRAFEGALRIERAPRGTALRAHIAPAFAGVLPAVLARVKHLFDLACHPEEVAAALGPVAARHPGLRLPGAADGFELAVRAILGQQVTVAAATTLAGRFAERLGTPLAHSHERLTRIFPSAASVAALEAERIGEIGIVATRARAIVALARAVHRAQLVLDPSTPMQQAVERLRSIPGIGPWTAEYIAMRALAWPDAFLPTDVAIQKALGLRSPAEAARRAEAWRPWRSYAVMHLWKSLEGKTP